jgi:predicted MPP superfamily phosphohydrolase
MGPFAIVISFAVLLSNALAWGTWAHFSGGGHFWLTGSLSSAVGLAFLAAALLGFRHTSPALRMVYRISAAWLGFLNYAMFAGILCWITLGLSRAAHRPISELKTAQLLFGAAIAATVYGLVNAAWLRVTRVTVPLPHLPAAWQGRTAALITDLHLGHIAGPRFVRRVIGRLRRSNPDLVLISGDMFDGSPLGLDRLVADWKDFSAPRGIFYVTGNHDEFAERGLYLQAVERTGIRVLNNQKVTVEGLQIVGVHDSEATDPAALAKILRSVALRSDQPSVLLAHRPGNLPVVEAAGINLQVSGHTHEGQMFPWSLVVHRVWGRFAYGLNRLGRLWVYTSSGAGTWGPPLRVGTRSELVLIRFESAQ